MRANALFPACVLAAGMTAGVANADTILEASGWRVEVDTSLVDNVMLNPLSATTDELRVIKSAEFDSVSNLTGIVDSIVLQFTQIDTDENTADRIVLDSEVITNSTGVDWSSFVISVLGSSAEFNGTLSSSFAAPPFPNADITSDEAGFSGGVLPDGGVWLPGLFAGNLVIDIDLDQADPVTFGLKELPIAVPAPGAGVLALCGFGAMARRRR